MLRKFLVLLILLMPLTAYAKQSGNIGKYLLGTWKVEGIKAKGSTTFRPLRHPRKWIFKRNGELVEELGANGTKVTWHYHVIGHDIQVQLGHMTFVWQVLGMEGKVMLVKHQLGLFKVRHM